MTLGRVRLPTTLIIRFCVLYRNPSGTCEEVGVGEGVVEGLRKGDFALAAKNERWKCGSSTW